MLFILFTLYLKVLLKIDQLIHKYFIMTNIDIFNNEQIMIFENNIHWYMYKYLEIIYV